jgi:hypothetical protein
VGIRPSDSRWVSSGAPVRPDFPGHRIL